MTALDSVWHGKRPMCRAELDRASVAEAAARAAASAAEVLERSAMPVANLEAVSQVRFTPEGRLVVEAEVWSVDELRAFARAILEVV